MLSPASLPTATDPLLMKELGQIPGVLMPAPFAEKWDPLKGFLPEHRWDAGWILETEEGVMMRQHPETALLERPALWPVYSEVSAGQVELTERDWREKSAFDYDAKRVMVMARMRAEARGVKSNG